jgi:hypothetical protein
MIHPLASEEEVRMPAKNTTENIFRFMLDAAADLLIAAKFAKKVLGGFSKVEQVFRGLNAFLEASPKVSGDVKLKAYLRQPLAPPAAFRPVICRREDRKQEVTSPAKARGKEK